MRRNFLGFGKRSMGGVFDQNETEEGNGDVEKRALAKRNFIRFGRSLERMSDEGGRGKVELETGRDKRERRRMSNFLRFGRSQGVGEEEELQRDCVLVYPFIKCLTVK